MRCFALQISDRDGSLSRTYLSPAHRLAAKQVGLLRLVSICLCVGLGIYFSQKELCNSIYQSLTFRAWIYVA